MKADASSLPIKITCKLDSAVPIWRGCHSFQTQCDSASEPPAQRFTTVNHDKRPLMMPGYARSQPVWLFGPSSGTPRLTLGDASLALVPRAGHTPRSEEAPSIPAQCPSTPTGKCGMRTVDSTHTRIRWHRSRPLKRPTTQLLLARPFPRRYGTPIMPGWRVLKPTGPNGDTLWALMPMAA
jgi:hypothetical protein